MKKIFFLLSAFLYLTILAGCKNKSITNTTDEKPELAPICPEGYYWIDSIKSCTLILEE